MLGTSDREQTSRDWQGSPFRIQDCHQGWAVPRLPRSTHQFLPKRWPQYGDCDKAITMRGRAVMLQDMWATRSPRSAVSQRLRMLVWSTLDYRQRAPCTVRPLPSARLRCPDSAVGLKGVVFVMLSGGRTHELTPLSSIPDTTIPRQ